MDNLSKEILKFALSKTKDGNLSIPLPEIKEYFNKTPDKTFMHSINYLQNEGFADVHYKSDSPTPKAKSFEILYKGLYYFEQEEKNHKILKCQYI